MKSGFRAPLAACSADAHIILFLVEGGLVLLPDEGDLLACHVLDELRVEVLGADDVLLHVCAFLVGLPVGRRVDADLGLLEVLLVELLQRNRADGRVGVLLLEGSVGDERGDVLFELCQVLDDVVLGEDNTILVVLLLGNAEEELALLEHVDHHFNMSLYLSEHVLRILSVVLRLLNLGLEHFTLILQRLLQIDFLLHRHLASLINLGDLLLDLLVAFFELIVLRVEHVDIVEQTVVLLFCFDEGGHDFFDI